MMSTIVSDNLARVEYEVETLGFSVVADVIAPDEAAVLREALIEALERDTALHGMLPGKRGDLIDNLVLHGRPFTDLLDNAVMHEVFSRFLTEHCILYNYGSTVLLPGADSKVLQIHVDSPRVIPGYHDGLIMTLALDEFNEANGATRYLPGSQNLLQAPSEETFSRYSLSVARHAGSAVFFNPRAFHRGMPNASDRTRCGVTVFAVRPFMKQRFDFPSMLAAHVAETLTPRARKFLGFDARPPAAMSSFYAPVERRTYKPNQE